MYGRFPLARTWLGACTTLLLLPLAAPVAAQQRADSGTFIVKLGRDTLAIERYVRSGGSLQGIVITRSPRTNVARYTFSLAPDGTVREYGSAREPDSVQARPVAVPGSIPVPGGSYTPYQLALQQARAAGGDSTTVTLLAGDNSIPIKVRRISPTSYQLPNQFDVEMNATVDSLARIVRVDVAGGTTVERVAWLDIDALAREFRARDEAGRGLGALSPRDTTDATVKGAHILVDYSRPSLRGRELSQLAPDGQVWRTGANAATHLSTDRELRFGNVTVPAGTYTLFTLPSAGGWKLILNRQTGQGGLDYDQTQDLARFDMETRRDAPHTEQLTIDVAETAQGGVLRILFGTLSGVVPFTVGS
jgi:hypothetical protein